VRSLVSNQERLEQLRARLGRSEAAEQSTADTIEDLSKAVQAGELGAKTEGGEDAGTELTLAEERGLAAVKAAHIEYLRGVELYGDDRSWETDGSNRGELVDEYQDTNDSTGQAWCGMFIGHSYEAAGIRPDILDRLVFWSGYRLHLFLTEGKYIGGSFGDWWQQHQTVQIGSQAGEQRKAALDGFNPKAGDIALFRSDYSHVGMVTEYDSETGDLFIIEGNRGNRVQANIYDTGDDQITFLGRFNDGDYGAGSEIEAGLAATDNPVVDYSSSDGGSIS